MDPRPDPALVPAPEPRQRWRLVVSRAADAPRLTQRELADAWEAALVRCELPVAVGSGSPGRPRIAFGAPLPVGMAAERDLIDLYLRERWPRWRVRDSLEPGLPAGSALVDLEDVWLGGPALTAAVVAADYRVVLDSDSAAEIAEAAKGLIAADSIPRQREKGGGTVEYNLRPLLDLLEVADPGPPVTIRARTRFHPSLGTGRPEEVVAALETVVGRALTPVSIVRERLWLADELGPEVVSRP